MYLLLCADVSLHQYAIEEGLLAVILQIIHTSTKRTPPPSDWEGVSTLIHPVVSCLLLLSQSSSDIRRALRDDQHLIKDLLMCEDTVSTIVYRTAQESTCIIERGKRAVYYDYTYLGVNNDKLVFFFLFFLFFWLLINTEHSGWVSDKHVHVPCNCKYTL